MENQGGAGVMNAARILWLGGLLCASGLRSEATPVPAAWAGPMVTMLDATRVKLLDGPFKTRQELHRTGYLASWEVDKLLYHYRATAGIAQPAGVTSGYSGWDSGFLRGHMAGHFLSAAARMYAATGDLTYRTKADALVAGLAACQTALGTGHLAAFPESVLTAFEAGGINTDLGSTGGIVVPYYTIHKVLAGLVDADRYLGSTQALAMAEAMADRYAARMAALTPAQIEALLRTDGSRNPITEHGGMSDALTELAELSGHTRHRDLARIFIRDWFTGPLAAGQDNLYGLHANTHIAQAMGIARFAKDTGDSTLVLAMASFWNLLTGPRAFVTGGNSFNEWLDHPNVEAGPCIHDGAALPYSTAETCGTHNMLKYTRQLFETAPSADKADYFERALYNHILSSIAPDTGRVIYFHPHQGAFKAYIPGTECCVGTGIENTARYGEGIYFQSGSTLWVNLYIPSEVNWSEQGLTIRQTGNIPCDSSVTLAVAQASSPVNATLRLRVPAWVAGTVALTLNGENQSVSAAPSSYIELTRTWSQGDTLTLTLPAALRMETSKDVPSQRSVCFGPLVLAARLGNAGIANDIVDKHSAAAASEVPVPLVVGAPDSPSAWLTLTDPASLTFAAHDCGPASGLLFAPVYAIHHERYAVYVPMLGQAEGAPLSFGAAPPLARDGVQNLSGAASNGGNVLLASDNNYLAGDGRAQGQTFTTGGSPYGYMLSSIAVQQVAYASTYWDYDGGMIDLQLFRPGAFNGSFYPITVVTNESSAVPGSVSAPGYSSGTGAGIWMTITFAHPVRLDPNTQYGFQIAANGTGGNGRFFLQLNGTQTNAFAGGFAVNSRITTDGTTAYTGSNAANGDTAQPESSGVWSGGAADSGQDRVFVASMTALSAYGSWAVGVGLDGSPGKESGFDADPDEDGVANGMEWILDGNPLAPDPATTRVQMESSGPDGLTFQFLRRAESAAVAPLVVDWDTDLVGSFDHSVAVGAVSSAPDSFGVTVTVDASTNPNHVTVHIPASNATNANLFARLEASCL